MRRLVVRCPICHTQKNEIVDDELLRLRKTIERGIVIIKISKGRVCEHPIYLEIDRNFSIRDTYSQERLSNLPKEQYPHILELKAY